MPSPTVTLVSPQGVATDVPADQADAWVARGFSAEGADARAQRVAGVARDASTNAVDAFGQSLASTATFGASDVVQRAVGGEDARIYLQQLEKAHPVASTLGGFAGALLPQGGIAKVAGAVADVGRGAGVAGAAVRGGIEGGAMGFGQGVHEISLSDDPLTAERAASVLSSNMLFGATIGGAAGGLTKLAEKGIARTKVALDESAAKAAAASTIPADLAELAPKELRAARAAETDALEQGRIPQRQQLADDIAEFRASAKDEKVYLATKDADVKDIGNVREVGKISLKADRKLDNVLDNPIKLAERPQVALDALQQQEHALTQLTKNEPELRAAFAADETGARAAALDAVPAQLEKNRALQARIREQMAPHASERLTAIDTALDAATAPAPEKGLAEKMLGGSVFGMTTGAVGSVPLVGPLLAHVAAAKASDAVTNLVFGRLANATGEVAKKTSQALGAFLDTSAKLAPYVPVLATKVLQKVRYAPDGAASSTPASSSGQTALVSAYKARSAEIRTQTAYDDTGTPRMRPEARQAMAAQLSPVRIKDPRAADAIETIGARRIEFLASKLPRRPDLDTMRTGPDRWQPSEFEMRTFARYAAAVEDPGAIEHRLSSGTVTPEDAEAYHAVYPERAQAFKQMVIEKLPTLQKTLPYAKRLALSIFTGVPVDAAMDPQIMAVLQGSFSPQATDHFQAPQPAPQFGSVKKSAPQPTPAQARNG